MTFWASCEATTENSNAIGDEGWLAFHHDIVMGGEKTCNLPLKQPQRRDRNNCRTYQNKSATDANNAREAATCCPIR